MSDGLRLGIVISIITIAVPVFFIMSSAKAQVSQVAGLEVLQQAGDGDIALPERMASSTPEEALYLMYDSQAMKELERCTSGDTQPLCEDTVKMIVDSCTDSQVDLAVCHDSRVEQLMAKA
jgi:hypothetical protein